VAWNRGHAYRNDGVDIKSCTDSLTNGFNVAWMEPGEWLQYTLTAPSKNVYDLNLRVKTDSVATIQIFINGKPVAATTFSKAHTDSNDWQTVSIKKLSFSSGTTRLRVYVQSGTAELNYIQFTKTKALQTKSSTNKKR